MRERYRTVDVLLIDDIQFIAGKESTQEEFFHTFNELYNHGKQVVVTSDRPPKALVTLEERLQSRFEWGLMADIQVPDTEMRKAILQAKADEQGYHVPDYVFDIIAHHVRDSIRELEGALNKVIAFSQFSDTPITEELVDMALADLLRRPDRPTLERVVEVVCRYYGVTLMELVSASRKREVAYPRQIAMYMARSETDASLPQIGTYLGGRDHTTVIYGCEKIAREFETNSATRREVLEIKAQLYENKRGVVESR
jgi:chromosomal replication initiator protein